MTAWSADIGSTDSASDADKEQVFSFSLRKGNFYIVHRLRAAKKARDHAGPANAIRSILPLQEAGAFQKGVEVFWNPERVPARPNITEHKARKQKAPQGATSDCNAKARTNLDK